MKTTVVEVSALGGSDVLQVAERELGAVPEGHVRLRQRAAGVNFIDVYHRSGLYPGGDLPFVVGNEGAGEVLEAGCGFEAGDRVAYCLQLGGYASVRDVPAEKLVRLPDGVTFEDAAAVMIKGLTAGFLANDCHVVKPGEWALVHAAAGGVGGLLCPWLTHLGARVIGLVGSEAKRDRVRGCEAVLVSDGDWAEKVRELSGGVAVAYDSVGAATFEGTLDTLARRGNFVSYGNASGKVPPFEPLELMRRGSLRFTRPILGDFIATREELEAASARLFDLLSRGVLEVQIDSVFPLSEARKAHDRIESRQSVGPVVLSID